jgi:hypothetical protein
VEFEFFDDGAKPICPSLALAGFPKSKERIRTPEQVEKNGREGEEKKTYP